ncbi:hypothetical protein [Mycolicibacterium sp. CR10]|uniref:hypothetical protein n=1 Tax=Mycolicibacterium sp. CR10 TaxID=2562314 RepID=UPI0010C002EB|nr:hypothetical protein [Mycolicibacterium sp. CR10]
MADGDDLEGDGPRTYDVVTRPGAGAGSYSQPLYEQATGELERPAPAQRPRSVALLDPWDRATSPEVLGNRATAAAGTQTEFQAAVAAVTGQLFGGVVPYVEPGRSIVEFDGVQFSESEAYNRRQLMFFNLTAGTKATKAFVDAFQASVTSEAWEVRDEPRDAVERRVAVIHQRRTAAVQATRRALTSILAERDAFLDTFRKSAEAKVLERLKASEDRVYDELLRYDVVTTTQTLEAGLWAVSVKTHSMKPTDEVSDLAAAAGELARLRKRINTLEAQRQSALKPDPDLEPGAGAGSRAVSDEGRAEYERLTVEIDAAEKQFTLLREAEIEEFPVLAAFTDDVDALEDLATGATGDNAKQIAERSQDVLDNIQKVRDGLDGRFSVWKQSKVLDETKAEAADSQWKRNWVDEKSAEVRGDESDRSLLLAVVAIGLGILAAIPTGGSSLVAAGTFVAGAGAAAISTYTVYEHVAEYRLESAASGTDYDKARAISEEEPSLFWLALDVVGAAIDLSAAAKAFRAVVALRRTALAADALDEAALATLRREGNQIGADLARPLPGLGDKLADDVAKQRKAFDEAFDDAAKEANAAAQGEQATQRVRRLSRAARRVRQVLADLIEQIRKWAAKAFAAFGFKYFTVEINGEWVEVYGHRSPKILVARFKIGVLEEYVINETEALKRLRHSRASQLGKAAATADDELAKILRGNAVQISEDIGERSAEQAVKRMFKGADNPAAKIYHGHGRGVLDLVFELDDGTIIIVEAKGGAGRIGTRIVAPGVEAQQGHRRYLLSILDEMEKDAPEVVAKVRDALKRKRLRYLYSETPIPEAGEALETTLKEFKL